MKQEIDISNLTQEQEDKLKEIHAKQYTGLDDDMPDDFENWIVELTKEELEEYLR